MGEDMETKDNVRLVITHMELENFKSYAGVQRIGPFHKSFSSVVGPNGSGKSNVIDSMLFVFGKRAKQLRLNKVSELIHNSTNFQNLEYARVSVFFQDIIDHDGENFEPIAGSQITVTRIAYRNNSSKYLIDDRTSNFTEVTNVLKAKGIDLDNNRFLILQGEVEQISMMKPKAQGPHDEGLLEYLEDIIGSNKYVEKIEEEAKKLEELNEKRSGLVHRLKITEKERDALESAKTEAESYMQKEQQLLRWQGTLHQIFLHKIEGNLAKIGVTKTELEAKLAHEKEKYVEYNKGLEEKETLYTTCTQEHGAIQAELTRTDQEFKEFERKDIKYREDLKFSKQKLKKVQEKMAKDETKLENAAKQEEALTAEIPEAEARGEAMALELPGKEAELEALQESLKGAQEAVRVELEAARVALAPLSEAVNAAEANVKVGGAEKVMLEDLHAGNKQRLQEAKVERREAEAAILAKQGEIKRMKAALKDHNAKAGAADADEAAATAEEETLTERVRLARANVETKKHALNSVAQQGKLMKALLAAKAEGLIPGIFGRLGDLGAIDKEYDVAVSTACGPLDFVVVDTTSTAQKCVKLLRENHLGVATFLMLDQQQKFVNAAKEVVSAPEGCSRLFDLVRVSDERLKPAFYYALKDTIVANDLDQASRIAYGKDKRWSRVVTLKGELIEPSGTMSGGGGRPRGGRMRVGDAPSVAESAGASKETVDQASFELREAAADLDDRRRAAANAKQAAAAARKAADQLEGAIPKAEAELEALKARVGDLTQQLAALEAAADMSGEDASRLKELAKELASAEKVLAKAVAAAEKPAAAVAALQEKMDTLGGDSLKMLKEAVAGLRNGIEAAAAEAAKKRATIKTLAKSTERTRKEIAEAGAEKEALAKKMENMKGEFKDLEDKALVVQEAFNACNEALETKAAELKSLKAEYEKVQAAANTIRTVEVDIGMKLEDMERHIAENKGNKKHWGKQLDETRKKLMEALGGVEMPALLSEEELAEFSEDDAHIQVTMLETTLAEMKPDMGAIADYAEKDTEYSKKAEEVDGVTKDRDTVRTAHDDMRKRRLDDFMSGFNAITLKLKEMYQMITLGGDAELELVDSLDPFSEGIVFSVRPPKKSWKNISNLSGGEKTLSSLSLVFALHHYKPTPLYVMDEIDAALDFKNVSIVAHYIKERTKNAQFIIISLRNNMFELADRLVGIYKTDNTTKSIAVNPGQFQVGADITNSASARSTLNDAAHKSADAAAVPLVAA